MRVAQKFLAPRLSRRHLLSLGLAGLATSLLLPGRRGLGAGPRRRVIVVGAGLAGLAAAQTLQQQGHQVLVLEGRERIGGRTITSALWPDLPLDLGAGWIHGVQGNPITALARSSGAALVPTDLESIRLYGADGKPLPPDQEARLEQLGQGLGRHLEAWAEQDDQRGAAADLSLAQVLQGSSALRALAAQDSPLLAYWLNSRFEQEHGAAADSLSARWLEADQAYGGGDALLQPGFSTLIRALARGLTLVTSQRVVAINDRGAQGVEVVSSPASDPATSRIDRADAVLVTVPLGVLKAGRIAFSPPLPAGHQTAIERLGMGNLNKCCLRFARPFWPADADWFGRIGAAAGAWQEWFSLLRSLRQPVLIGFQAGPAADALEGWSDQQQVAAAMASLRQLHGHAIPDPIGVQITRWRSDPFALGAYSYPALGSTAAMREQLARPIADRLFFAGEATSAEAFGTTHGAYRSGVRAAAAIEVALQG